VGCFLLLLDGRDLLAGVCVLRGVEDLVQCVVGVTFRWCGCRCSLSHGVHHDGHHEGPKRVVVARLTSLAIKV
jgi:hypothetical protein